MEEIIRILIMANFFHHVQEFQLPDKNYKIKF